MEIEAILFVSNFNYMVSSFFFFLIYEYSIQFKHQKTAAFLSHLHASFGTWSLPSKFPLKFRKHTHTHTHSCSGQLLLFLHGCSTAPLPAHALRVFSIPVKGLCCPVFVRECVAKLAAFIPHVFSCSYLLLRPAFSASCFAGIFI